jgi:hypothetical protein
VNALRIYQLKMIVLVALAVVSAVTGGGLFDGDYRF